MTSKSVLFVSDNFPPVVGGTPTVYHQICSRNADIVCGLSSTHSAGHEKNGWQAYDAMCGYSMHRFKYLKSPQLKTPKLKLFGLLSALFHEVSFAAKTALLLARLLVKKNISVVCIGELVYCGWLGLVCKYVFRKKLIIYCHGEELTTIHNTRTGSLRKFALQKADIIIAVSQFCSDAIVSKYDIQSAKIRILTNGVSLEDFYLSDVSKKVLKGPEYANKKLILAAGRHVQRKGFDALIKALPAIVQNVPNAHLVILGEGPETKNLKSLADTLKMSTHIDFKGQVTDASLRHHYQMADVFVMPNKTMPDGDTEGFGLVFLEANACGTISVGGRAGGATEAVQSGVSGYSVNYADLDELTHTVSNILANDAARQALEVTALEFARGNSWQKSAILFRDIVMAV